MRLFVVVFFGMAAAGALVKAIQLMASSYPRVETFSVGEDAARLVESVATAMIAAYVLWG